MISPVDGIGPDKLKIKELLARLTPKVREVILATNPSVEGEATAMYLSRLIRPLGVKVTRLGLRLPVGATLEYADGVTLLKGVRGPNGNITPNEQKPPSAYSRRRFFV